MNRPIFALIQTMIWFVWVLCLVPVRGETVYETTTIWAADRDLSVVQMATAIDPFDRPHVLFTQWGTDTSAEPGQRVIYGTVGDAGWIFESVAVGSWRSGDHSLAIDQLGRPHIAMNDPDARDGVYGVRDGTGWSFETLGVSDSWTIPAMEIDPQQRPVLAHFSYESSGTVGTPVLTTRNGAGDWTEAPVLVSPAIRDFSDEIDLVFDASGSPHIAYTGLSNWAQPWFVSVVSPDPAFGGALTENRVKLAQWNDIHYDRAHVVADDAGGVRVASSSGLGRHGELIHFSVSGDASIGDVVARYDAPTWSSSALAVGSDGSSWLLHSFNRVNTGFSALNLLNLDLDGTVIETTELYSGTGQSVGRTSSMVSDSQG